MTDCADLRPILASRIESEATSSCPTAGYADRGRLNHFRMWKCIHAHRWYAAMHCFSFIGPLSVVVHYSGAFWLKIAWHCCLLPTVHNLSNVHQSCAICRDCVGDACGPRGDYPIPFLPLSVVCAVLSRQVGPTLCIVARN